MKYFAGIVLVIIGIVGLAAGIEYAGWVLFVGLLVCL